MKQSLWLTMGLCVLVLGGCRYLTPSVGVGVGIPGTPIGVGVGVPIPLGRSGAPNANLPVVYRQLVVNSDPQGAELYINGTLVGSTPMTAAVPFEKGFWGDAKGSAQLLLKKPGYLPEGLRIYALKYGLVSRAPDGLPVKEIVVPLRRQ